MTMRVRTLSARLHVLVSAYKIVSPCRGILAGFTVCYSRTTNLMTVYQTFHKLQDIVVFLYRLCKLFIMGEVGGLVQRRRPLFPPPISGRQSCSFTPLKSANTHSDEYLVMVWSGCLIFAPPPSPHSSHNKKEEGKKMKGMGPGDSILFTFC